MATSFVSRNRELRRAIDRDQAELERAMTQLRRTSRELISVRHHLERDPWGWLLRACALGLLLGLRAGRQA